MSAASPCDLGWLVARTSCGLTPAAAAIKATDAGGRIVGMVGYDNWTENACQAHMAVATPMAWRALVRPAFAYPFLQAGKGVILAVIPAGNARSVDLASRFGFMVTHRVRDGWAVGEDLICLEMRRENCRWIQG